MFTRQHIMEQMKRTRLVPLFTHDNAEIALAVLETCYHAGVRVFEFTNRKKNSFEVFCALVNHRSKFPELMLGVGTVMDDNTTGRYLEAGADFIISPIVKTSMAVVCERYDKMWIPGCATLTEIVTAKEHGADVIKIFPGSVLGPQFVSAILPVVPDLNLMITGGVEPTEKSITEWLSAGAMCVGMGSKLFDEEVLARKDWKKLEQRILTVLQLTKK